MHEGPSAAQHLPERGNDLGCSRTTIERNEDSTEHLWRLLPRWPGAHFSGQAILRYPLSSYQNISSSALGKKGA